MLSIRSQEAYIKEEITRTAAANAVVRYLAHSLLARLYLNEFERFKVEAPSLCPLILFFILVHCTTTGKKLQGGILLLRCEIQINLTAEAKEAKEKSED
jgi:hypothetical protein